MVVGVSLGAAISGTERRVEKRMNYEGKRRGDLVGNEGTVALTVTVIDAKEFHPMVIVKLRDTLGNIYWMDRNDIDWYQ